MKIALDRRTVRAAGIAADVLVIAAIVWFRWHTKAVAVPDPTLPGVSELPQWWWSLGCLGDWMLYPGADAGLWAINIDAWLEGAPLDLHRPPLFTILAGLFAHVFGDIVFAGHMVNHLLSLAVCLSIYAFGRSTSGRGAAMGAALLTAWSTELIISGAEFGVDASLQFALMFLVLMSWYAANGRWWRVIPAGIAAGLAAGAHFIAFAFVFPATALLLLADEPVLRWRRRALAVVVMLALSLLVWKLLMWSYPTASLSRILTLYGEAVNTYNRSGAPGSEVGIFQALGILVTQLWQSPTEPITRAFVPFASLSIPWPILLPLCLLGLAGPGLRKWHSLKIRLQWESSKTQLRSSRRGWEWRPGLRLHVQRPLGWDYRPGLWLAVFLLPMAVAAAANAPSRYTLYCTPLLFLTATRGVATIATGFEHLLSGGDSRWPKGLLAFLVCLVLLLWVGRSVDYDAAKHQDQDTGFLQRVVGEHVREGFGEGGCLVTYTPEICYFAGGSTCPSSQCAESDDYGLGQCIRRFMDQAPMCRGDLAYTVEPGTDRGPFLDSNELMNELIAQRFEVDETFQQGQKTIVLYRLDRATMEDIMRGGVVWLQPPTAKRTNTR